MRKNKLILSCIALLLCLLICVPVFAIDNVDESRYASLIVYSPEELKGDQVQYSIYLVASMDRRGNLTTTDGFVGCKWEKPYMEAQDSWGEALQILLYWLDTHKSIKAYDRCIADKFGTARFPTKGKTLVKGLYLVVANPVGKSGSTKLPAPFLVSVPDRDKDDNWIYTMTAEPKAVETSVHVRKVWQDEGHTEARPTSVVATLCYGWSNKVYASVVLSAQNNWMYTWENLPAGVQWTVIEENVPAQYAATVKAETGGFLITNAYVSQKIPQTGQITWPIPVLTVLGLGLFFVGLTRYRKNNEEK